MNKNLIVTIFVPTGQGMGKSGTGYPVAEDLILTSRHTIDGERGKIQVQWHYYKDADAPWITRSTDDIVWKGEGELDAVLLRCPRPQKAQGKGWGVIADKKPPSNESWQSAGFPLATRYENVRHPDDVSGTTESMADQADHFVLNVTSSPENPDMWAGASGMPVFVDNEILGVVGRAPKNFGARKLYAVPCWKMFEDEKFRELIMPFQEDQITKAIRNIEGLFKDEDFYGDSLRKLVLLCKKEKSCKNFLKDAEAIREKYGQLEESISDGNCDLSFGALKRTGIRISARLLLIDMKKCFYKNPACLKYEKEALRMEKQCNKLRERKVKLEEYYDFNNNLSNAEQLKNILEYLNKAIEYLRQAVKFFFCFTEKFSSDGRI
jgi:hypothetical protein